VDSLKNEIIDVANKILATSAPRAAEKLVEILESEDPIPQVGAKLQAAQTLLDRVGIAKREKLDVTHTAAGGIFIIPEKRDVIDVNAEDVTPDDE
jgi:mevalonate kinase